VLPCRLGQPQGFFGTPSALVGLGEGLSERGPVQAESHEPVISERASQPGEFRRAAERGFRVSGAVITRSQVQHVCPAPRFERDAQQLSAPGQVTITSDSLVKPCRPAFDQAGDLWAGNYSGQTVVEFTKAELAKSGSPAPKVVLSSPALNQPGDVAFDPSGNLWVPNSGANTLIGFNRSQLAKSGSQPPAFNISGPSTGLDWPWAVATEP
jgi:hypothetical protein